MRWSVRAAPRSGVVRARLAGLLLALATTGGCAALPAGASAPPAVTPAADADGVLHVRFEHRAGVPAAAPVVPVPLGSTVELVVGSDVAERVLLSGYGERVRYVTAGGTVTLRYVLDRPGALTVSLGDSGAPVGRLDVR